MAGTLEGLDRRDDAELAVDVMEFLQEGNVIGFFRVFSDPRAQFGMREAQTSWLDRCGTLLITIALVPPTTAIPQRSYLRIQ